MSVKKPSNRKIEVKDEVFSLPVDLTSTQKDINLINSTTTKDTCLKHALSLVVNRALIFEFEELLNSFKSKTKAYFTYPSKVQLFETGCSFLKQEMISENRYKKAPSKFIKYISRKGKRPISEEQQERKGNSKPMYLTISQESYDIYCNLIFSFLSERNDIGNEVYSTSYFFKDFLGMLKFDFNNLCKYEKTNPRD